MTDVNGSYVKPVTHVDSGPEAFSWSPTGKAIAFTMYVVSSGLSFHGPVPKPAGARWAAAPHITSSVRYQQDGQREYLPGRTQIFLTALDGTAARQLTSGDADAAGTPSWAPFGDALFYSSQVGSEQARSYLTSRIFRVSVTDGRVDQLETPGLGARDPAVSPDGTKIAFVATTGIIHDYEAGGLYIMHTNGGAIRRLDGDLDREIEPPVFSSDGKSVFAAYGDRGRTRIARFELDGGNAKLIDDLSGPYSVASNGAIAFTSASAVRPAELAIRMTSGQVRALTQSNDVLLTHRRLAKIETLKVRSSLDGATVGTWVTLPANYDSSHRYPTILSIHGGPYGFDGPRWNSEDQLAAAAGYIVLHVNYRGSTSYGFAFANRISRDYPKPSYADLMSAVDAAVSAGIADPDRLFVTGGSAGGQLTAWIVGSTDRFKAAVPVKPIINAVSDALTTDQANIQRLSYGSFAWESPQIYADRSPLSLVGRVRTPTLLIVGELDHRTPVSEAQQFYSALVLQSVPAALVTVPDAGHANLGARPSQAIAISAITLDWFGRHGGIATPRTVTGDR